MASPTKTGSTGVRAHGGFTLIELLVVMTIIATLMALVAPNLFKQVDHAKEVVLRHNLATLRDTIAHYREDRGRGPATLESLVAERYLREVPLDPVTARRDTWIVQLDDAEGIREVKSGAPGAGGDGIDYAQW
jgi:general secretion pathway protein G